MGNENAGYSQATTAEPFELVLQRDFAAPRGRVFAAWTDKGQLAAWWGPRQCPLTECELDLRPGGVFNFVMTGPDGSRHAFEGEFLEVKAPERLVFAGQISRLPESRVVTEIQFEEHGQGTRIKLRQTHALASEATAGARAGWTQSLDKLEEWLAGEGRRS